MDKKMRKPKTTGDTFNYIHNSIDTFYWVVKPLTYIGAIPTAAGRYLRNIQGFVVAANFAANLIDESEAKDKKSQTVTA